MRFVAHSQIGVTVLDNFISEDEVQDALSFFQDMEESTVCTEDGEGEKIEARTGLRKWVEHDQSELFHGVCKRIADFLGTELSCTEKAQFLKYGKGERYDPHYDAFDKSAKQWSHYNNGGQRVYTAMGYLNDVYLGGATTFPLLGLDVQPRRGRVLVWSNVGEDFGVPHPDSLHGGMPVEEGEKRCFTLWFRENPINES